MDVALLQLLALRMRGGLRTRMNQLLTLRGLIYFGISCIVPLLIWFGMVQANAVSGTVGALPMESILVLGLAAATLLSLLTVTSPAFHFSPEEIHFLGAGPFTHQALLLYKLLSSASGALLTALFLTMLTGGMQGRLPAAIFFGSFLTLLFLQLTRAALRSGIRLVGRSIRYQFPAYTIPMSALAIAVLAWPLFHLLGHGPIEALIRFCETETGEYVLMPFKTFVRVAMAERVFPDLLMYLALGVAINLGLLSLLLRLEHAIESCADNSPFESGYGSESSQTSRQQTLQFAESVDPTYFRLSGWGPLAWRQCVNARRTAGTALMALAALALAAAPMLVHGLSSISVPVRIGIALTFAIFVFPKSMVFDFRDDSACISWLKSLPLRPSIVALGQLTTPVVLTTAVEALFLLGAMILSQGDSQRQLAGLLPFLLPFNVLLYSIENVLFLLLPFRLLPTGRVDFEFFGRSVIEVLAKMLLLSLVILLAASAGRVGSDCLGESSFVFYAVTWATMSGMAGLAVMLVGVIFRNRDFEATA